MNKYLVTFLVPVIELKFDAYIPNNKKIGTIKKKILSYIMEYTDNSFNIEFENLRLIDKLTGINYINNIYVKDTNIKNGSIIILI